MTASLERQMTAGQLEEQTPEGQREMAAARIMVRAAAILERAFEQSGKTQRELADTLGVTEGRVSQVLHGDGNVKLSTLARYLRAMGYGVGLNVQPADKGVPALEQVRRGRARRRNRVGTQGLWVSMVEHGGSAGIKVVAMSGGLPLTARETTNPQFVGTTSSQISAWAPVKTRELSA